MTSPPYWALRDYGTDPLIWDGNPTCQHQWENTHTRMHNGRGDCQKGALYRDQEPIPDKPISYASCVECGAWKGSLGLEPTPELYIRHLCDIFDEVKRVLKQEGTAWINLGDTYGGSKSRSSEEVFKRGTQKCLTLIPARFSIEMDNRGWLLRNELIWWKPNAMPSSVKDRFTPDFEKVFLFTKSTKYYFKTQYEPQVTKPFSPRLAKHNAWNNDPSLKRGKGAKAIMKYNPLGRNKRCVWPIPSRPFRGAHFATYPPALCETPLDAGCPVGGIVLDPFMGAGTTALVALEQGKDFVGIELNGDYVKIAEKRLAPHMPPMFVE